MVNLLVIYTWFLGWVGMAHFISAISHQSWRTSRSLRMAAPVKWIDRDGIVSSEPKLAPNSFTVATYNVLGPLHGQGPKHAYAPVSVTKWSRRRDHIVEHIQGLHADILCLQEVSGRGLKETFVPKLKHLGLECTGYAPSKQIAMARGSVAHKYVGCAMFHNSEKFELLASKRLHLRDYLPSNSGDTPFSYDAYLKFNPIVVCLLRHKVSNQTVLVANTHLFWDPEREDIKVAQAAAISRAITRFLAGIQNITSSDVPMILCGDFNAQPTYTHVKTGTQHKSGVFELLTKGRLQADHYHHPDQWYYGRDDPRKGDNPRLGVLESSLTFTHFCDVKFGLEDYQPKFTSKTDNFYGFIDHIWLGEGVQLEGVMASPVFAKDSQADIKAMEFLPIPSKIYPSDHLPVGIIASLKPTQPAL